MVDKDIRNWEGSIEELPRKAARVLRDLGHSGADEPTLRLIRDYSQRGILGDVKKRGREAVFDYNNLLRFVAARILLADGWPLSKIRQQLDVSSEAEIEALVPGLVPDRKAGADEERRLEDSTGPAEPGAAMSAVERIRRRTGRYPKSAKAGLSPAARAFGKGAARTSSIRSELREAVRRLGLPEDGPHTEEVTLVAIATWCQLLVETDRISRITVDEAEELGRILTATLIKLRQKKDKKK